MSAQVLGRLQGNADFSRLANGTKEKKESKPRDTEVEVDLDELMGQDVARGTIGSGWLPPPPEIARPRALFNAGTMAYLGDGVYQMYAKRHFLLPPKTVNALNERVLGLVRCETQAAMLRKLCNGAFLTEEERAVVRWGKNAAQDSSRKAIRRAGGKAYGEATALETLIGFLYLTNPSRLDALMTHIGFGFNSSTVVIEGPEGIPLDEPNKSDRGGRLEAVEESGEAPGLLKPVRVHGNEEVSSPSRAGFSTSKAVQDRGSEPGAYHRGTASGEEGLPEAPGSVSGAFVATAGVIADVGSALDADVIGRIASAAVLENEIRLNGAVFSETSAVTQRERGEEREPGKEEQSHVAQNEDCGSSSAVENAERIADGFSSESSSCNAGLSEEKARPPQSEESAGASTGTSAGTSAGASAGASTGAATGRSGSPEQSETGAREPLPECSPEVKAVWEKTKRFLWQKYRLGTKLSPEDRDFILREVLAYHPNAAAKIGCGTEAITVDFSRQSRANRCFHVIRTDGTQEDFSYHKCLRVRRGILEQAPEAAPAPSLLQVGIGTHAELGSSC